MLDTQFRLPVVTEEAIADMDTVRMGRMPAMVWPGYELAGYDMHLASILAMVAGTTPVDLALATYRRFEQEMRPA